jgi:hypothetical protein
MCHKTRRLSLVTATLFFGLGFDARTEADIIVDTPPGLAAGSQFRIIYVTESDTMATSPKIDFYDTFVNNDATQKSAGGYFYTGKKLTFSAIASTPTITAIAHIGVTNSPVFTLIGTKVANTDSTAAGGLWSGTLLSPIGNENATNPFVWTGTTDDGGAGSFGVLGNGAEEMSTLGIIDAVSGGWVEIDDDFNDMEYGMYGISQVLTVVPEPSSLWMITVGLGAAISYSSGRRRRHRSQRPVVQPNKTERAEDNLQSPFGG